MSTNPLAEFFNKFSVGQKIGGLAAINIIMLLFVFMVAMLSFNKIGGQLVNIAERSAPLTEKVTRATLTQLEQSLSLELFMRAQASEHDPEMSMKASEAFEEANHILEGAMKEAKDLAEEALAHAKTLEEKQEYKHVRDTLNKLDDQHVEYVKMAEELQKALVDGDERHAAELMENVEIVQNELSGHFEELTHELDKFISGSAIQAEHDEQNAIKMLAIIGAIAVGLGVLISWFIARGMAKTERDANVMTQCLTNLRNNVLIANENDELVYMNTSSEEELTKLQSGIREIFSDFDVKKIIGSSIHNMHANPDRIRRILRALRPGEIHTNNISIGDITLTLNVGGIFQGDKRMGSYAEWRNVTEQVMREKVQKELEANIESTAMRVNEASSQIAEGNMNLSERTEAQAANIEETTATVQQVTERVQQNAQNAQEALEIASVTRQAADRGGEVVRNAIDAMQEISASSNKINDIISVIDEIAFQTNLLALNAAVEAARAGEQGRGFAVVASEVRTLAGRSAKAAKEIKDLITESVEKVKIGTQQVNDTGECLNDIITNVQRVTQMMNEISDASQEQASSIGEVNKSVAQMDSFTQQNAALVEEAAAASRSLEEQASSLIEMIGGDAKSKKTPHVSEDQAA